jgi:anaerobic dimethyl sulfoxide reductase subunit B (iron-sulfur subunit)
MQLGFFFDQTRCSGCYTCIVACRQWHHSQADRRRVETFEEGEFPDVNVTFLSLSCLHCESPACVSACPTGALWKRKEDGIVLVNSEDCLGKVDCGQCRLACPYDAIGVGVDERVEKCDFCRRRIEAGEKPICVLACTTRALDVGPLEELKAAVGVRKEAKGFVHNVEVKPSIAFKPKI